MTDVQAKALGRKSVSLMIRMGLRYFYVDDVLTYRYSGHLKICQFYDFVDHTWRTDTNGVTLKDLLMAGRELQPVELHSHGIRDECSMP